jgi:hypothetical protein
MVCYNVVITCCAAHHCGYHLLLDPAILVTQANCLLGTVCDFVVITCRAAYLNPAIQVTKADSLRGTVGDFVVITCGEAHI